MSDVEVGKTPISPSVEVVGCFSQAAGKFPPVGRRVIQGPAVGVIELKLDFRFPTTDEADLQGVVN